MALVPPDTSSPFGRYALNPLLSLGRRWSTGGPTWLQRYLGSKLLTRWYKNTSSPIDAEVGGLRARLYPRNNFHCRHGLLRGRFPDQDWFPRLVEGAGAGFVFLDIGANIGVFALCAARDLPPDARIVALEPHPGTCARLETNLRFNNATRVEVVPLALGAEPGTLDLFENADGNIGGFSLHNTAKSAQTNVVPVEVMPLHRLCDEMAITRIDVMKIDIEGYEDRVLMPFLASAAPALWPRRILIEHLGSDMWEVDLFAELAARGYVERERTGDNVLLERRVADA